MTDKQRLDKEDATSYVPLKPGMPLTFGTLLRHIRKQRGMTLAQVSDASGIDQATISKMELGDRLPPELHTLVKISTALEIPEGSQAFKDLWFFAQEERASYHEDDVKQVLADVMQTRASTERSVLPVFVDDLVELISKSNAEAIRHNARSVTLEFADGAISRFQVLPQEKKGRK
jgi:transcriptional regulator with XRE-family HTH domain